MSEFRSERALELIVTELNLLRFFMQNPNRVISRMEVLNTVWGYDFDPNTDIVDLYIAYLRRKIDRDFNGKLLHTVRGFNYKLSQKNTKQALNSLCISRYVHSLHGITPHSLGEHDVTGN